MDTEDTQIFKSEELTSFRMPPFLDFQSFLPPCPPKGGYVLKYELIFLENENEPPFRGVGGPLNGVFTNLLNLAEHPHDIATPYLCDIFF